VLNGRFTVPASSAINAKISNQPRASNQQLPIHDDSHLLVQYIKYLQNKLSTHHLKSKSDEIRKMFNWYRMYVESKRHREITRAEPDNYASINNKYDDLHFFLAECMEDMLDDDTWQVGQQDLFIRSIQQKRQFLHAEITGLQNIRPYRPSTTASVQAAAQSPIEGANHRPKVGHGMSATTQDDPRPVADAALAVDADAEENDDQAVAAKCFLSNRNEILHVDENALNKQQIAHGQHKPTVKTLGILQHDGHKNQQNDANIIDEDDANDIAEFLEMLSAPAIENTNDISKTAAPQNREHTGESINNTNTRKKPRNQSLPKSAKRVMLQWYEDHKKWPYPKAADMVQMALETGLEFKQVDKWFKNKRQRSFVDPDRRVKGKKPQYGDVEKIAKAELECHEEGSPK
jgi:hypothetical protein